MRPISRLTSWRRDKGNAHKLLVTRSLYDNSWAVNDYNPEITPRKFGTFHAAIAYAQMIAKVRTIARMEAHEFESIGGDAA